MIVVGGGVVGLTTAVVLAESGRRVRIWAREPVERTTSAVAGGLWWPYRIEPEELVGEWALDTLAVYEELAARPDETGVRMVEGVHGGTALDGLGEWASRVAGLRSATAEEYPGTGLWARLPLIDMPVHLRWLRERFVAAGGAVEERTVTDLAAVDAAVVVNCTGLGARDLVPDPSVRPVRGQLVVVENPGVSTWLTSVDHSAVQEYVLHTAARWVDPGRYGGGGRVVPDAGPGDRGGDRAAVCGGSARDRGGADHRAPGGAAARPADGASGAGTPAGWAGVGAQLWARWGGGHGGVGVCEGRCAVGHGVSVALGGVVGWVRGRWGLVAQFPAPLERRVVGWLTGRWGFSRSSPRP